MRSKLIAVIALALPLTAFAQATVEGNVALGGGIGGGSGLGLGAGSTSLGTRPAPDVSEVDARPGAAELSKRRLDARARASARVKERNASPPKEPVDAAGRIGGSGSGNGTF